MVVLDERKRGEDDEDVVKCSVCGLWYKKINEGQACPRCKG